MGSLYIFLTPGQTLSKQQCNAMQILHALISILQKPTLLHLNNLVNAQNEMLCSF